MPGEPADELRAWVRVLKHGWGLRASSPYCDYYVAPHPGWQDPDRRRAQAELEIGHLLSDLDPGALRDWRVLELGCGVGRLARVLAPRVRSYTGVDVAPEMIALAQSRCADLGNARFLPSNGLGLSPPLSAERFELVLAFNVLIHCPRPVIASLVSSAYKALAPGGILRVHLLGDPRDMDGIASAEAAGREVAEARAMEAAATAEQLELLQGLYYMGDAFGLEDARAWLERWSPGGEVTLYRPSPLVLFGSVRKAP